MRKLLFLLTIMLASVSCDFLKKTQEDVGTAGAVVAAAGQTKLMSKDFIDTYFKVQSELIIHDVKFKGLSSEKAWARQNRLNDDLSKVYTILDKLQDVELLLHRSVLLKIKYEKEGLEPDKGLLDKIMNYGLEAASLIAEAAAIVRDIDGSIRGGN